MLFDTHCHLDAGAFDADRDAVMAAARAGGVEQMLVPAVTAGSFSAVRECCQRFPGCLPAYGIHPLYVDAADEKDLALLRDWLRVESGQALPAAAVGEIGLDFFHAGYDARRQERFLVGQLQIAAEFDLPVILHVRRAVDAVLKCLRQSTVRRGIAHAFNGSWQQAEAFVALGFKLGFGGAMTYPGSTRIRQLASSLPLEAIVLETDAPDIPPHWLRRGETAQRNTPDQLPRIATALAELRGVPVNDVAAATTMNAKMLLGLPV